MSLAQQSYAWDGARGVDYHMPGTLVVTPHKNGSSSGYVALPAIFLAPRAIPNPDLVLPSKSDREVKYDNLFAALVSMRDMDDDEPLAIDGENYRSACSALSYFSYNGFPPPQVFSHGGDAVVFTWPINSGSIFLTISNGLASLGLRVKGKGVVDIGHADLYIEGLGKLFPKVASGKSGTNITR